MQGAVPPAAPSPSGVRPPRGGAALNRVLHVPSWTAPRPARDECRPPPDLVPIERHTGALRLTHQAPHEPMTLPERYAGFHQQVGEVRGARVERTQTARPRTCARAAHRDRAIAGAQHGRQRVAASAPLRSPARLCAPRTSPTCWWKPAYRSGRVMGSWGAWCVRRSAPVCRSIGYQVRWRPAFIPRWPRRCPAGNVEDSVESRATPGGASRRSVTEQLEALRLAFAEVEGLNPRSCRA